MIFAGMIVYNEEFLIDACLRSIKDFVDRIIIVDGSPWGPSTDKTIEIAYRYPNVKIISGKFEIEANQRQTYFDNMEKGENNWCLKVDADEVWDDIHLYELLNSIKTASKETKHFQFKSYEFYGDAWHYIERGDFGYGNYQLLGACRLMEGIKFYNEHASEFGVNGENWCLRSFPITIGLPEVIFYHYGYAQPWERVKNKGLVWLRKGYKKIYGFGPEDEERYIKERLRPAYERLYLEGIEFTGQHPEEIQTLLPLMTREKNGN